MACVAQGIGYVGVSLGGLRVMGARAAHTRAAGTEKIKQLVTAPTRRGTTRGSSEPRGQIARSAARSSLPPPVSAT
jgi:hypothetical protein